MTERSFIAWLCIVMLSAATLLLPVLIVEPIAASAADLTAVMGDLDNNGVLNMYDQMALYRYVAGLTNFSVAQLRVADVTGDGTVSMYDVVHLYNVVSGKGSDATDPNPPTQPSSPTESTSRPTYATVSMTTVTGTSTTATTTPTSLVGIDVSYSQGNIDWTITQGEIDFAIIRCGYGQDEAGQDDVMWETNAAACEELGIPYGAYFFCYARTPQEAYGEAMHALRLLDGKKLTYPVFYDLEYSSWQGNLKPEEYATIATIFCDVLSAYGFKVGIYSNYDWWTNRLTAPCFDNWYRWVAQYNDTCDYKGLYHMWQYSEKGVVGGIDGNTVDMNYTYTDFSQLS